MTQRKEEENKPAAKLQSKKKNTNHFSARKTSVEEIKREADNTASRISVPLIDCDCGLTLTIAQL